MCEAFAAPLYSAATAAAPISTSPTPTFAAAVALAVIARETLNQHAREFRFPIEEDSVVRNEYVIEDREGLYAAEFGVPTSSSLPSSLRVSQGLAANNHKKAGSIKRYGK